MEATTQATMPVNPVLGVDVLELFEPRWHGSIYVNVYWVRATDEIFLAIQDEEKQVAEGEVVSVIIPNDRALDAYWHPMPYVWAHLAA